MEERESTKLMEAQLCNELRGIAELPPDTTEEYAQLRYKTIGILNDMYQKAYETENERKKLELEERKLNLEERNITLRERELEQRDAFEVQRKKEANRGYYTGLAMDSTKLALDGVRTGLNAYGTVSVINHECKGDKIFPSSMSSRLTIGK